jgi:hypothetical protein
MTDVLLTQQDADWLISLEKHRVNDERSEFPTTGKRISIPLASADGREQFALDLSRGRIKLEKVTMQNRARQVVSLVRIDFGVSHRNPNDEEIGSPHLHVYREGYGTKWAQTLPKDKFNNPDDVWAVLKDFMTYCNITKPPVIQPDLFT